MGGQTFDLPPCGRCRRSAGGRSWKVTSRCCISFEPMRWYASWSHDKGVPGKVVAKLMGHTNADVTLNVYTQVMDASLRTAVDRVGNELFTIVHSGEGAKELSH